MTCIRVYKKDELEYKRLEAVASVLSALVPSITVKLETVYYDFGSNWKYTALIVYPKSNCKTSMSYQLSDGSCYKAFVVGNAAQYMEALNITVMRLVEKHTLGGN